MPLSGDFDQHRMLIGLIAGGTSAFFHAAAVWTSEESKSLKKLSGELVASFGTGVMTTWLLGVQTLITVDTLGVFVAAAGVGFAFGPDALVIASRMAAKKFDIDIEIPRDETPKDREEP